MSLFREMSRLSPPLIYGRDIYLPSQQKVVYDNSPTVPFFLVQKGANPRAYREFLVQNEIGSVFDDLKAGKEVKVTLKSEKERAEFLAHPES